ncbi:SIR2 family protein [Pedobacter psychrodurus]|uniref:SIR2 family protein n=1 Tax=Pedobacter psychrodurus TaxID=2530456 RepID=A0A4R0PG42_9SPHI|nr:SIR2 family protein [Pedobacter psychrodurus]TCD16971.1 SIR2 family protein [Pedobacter psychrodurus]
MNISEFISNYHNHPVLFIGTGISLRYLENSYTWDGLLAKISFDVKENDEFYLDVKSSCQENGRYRFDKIASIIEEEFNKDLKANRNGKFKNINDIFYEKMQNNINLSRFKIYIAQIFSKFHIRPNMEEELNEFRKIRKNIGSIITTNYDNLIESTFEFNKLIGNDILLSNPYGSVYKIHGCSSDAGKMIITADDYRNFIESYELIRAQLLSLFIHNPIIFMGYGIGDENIKSILKTIFTYIEPNSDQAKKIRGNFLLVEYDSGSDSTEIVEHDIDMEGFSTVRINKLKTDNFRAIYDALSSLQLPVSALDIRKVQSIVKEIYSGGKISVKITEDLDEVKNSERILAIGTRKTITYTYLTSQETLSSYFKIIDESNSQALSFIDKYSISANQYFPIFGFSAINNQILIAEKLKEQQIAKLETMQQAIAIQCQKKHETIAEIVADTSIANSSKDNAIFWCTMDGHLSLDDVESYLRNYPNKKGSNFRKILSAYDYKKYAH